MALERFVRFLSLSLSLSLSLWVYSEKRTANRTATGRALRPFVEYLLASQTGRPSRVAPPAGDREAKP
jgi:hypothetical protein